MSDTKVIANLRLEKSLKDQAIDVATKMWLSLSAVMSLLLRKFVIEKKIEIGLDENWFTTSKKEILKSAIKDARENWEEIDSINDIL
jgi:antitoxin component of RelBE/YafQ-DinJ toxin-antitoxin module